MAHNSLIYQDLFSDEKVSRIFTDDAHIRSLLNVEGAVAKVQGELGIIPKDAATEISNILKNININPEELAKGTKNNGVIMPSLLNLIRAELSDEAASYLHFGMTSQDIIDTSLMIQLKAAFKVIEKRSGAVINELCKLADKHRLTMMAGRTRSQISTPITFGLKAANWMAPLLRHQKRLKQLTEENILLSIGGASGTLSVFSEENGVALAKQLKSELGLGLPTLPWHNQRDIVVEIAMYCSLLCGSLSKIADDVIFLCSSGIEELMLGGGASSTMPQKDNPVLPETIVAVGKQATSLANGMSDCQLFKHERDGAAWQLEWLSVPQIIILTAASLRHTQEMITEISVNSDNMAANIGYTNGTILAEAATFLLMTEMNRFEAQAKVKEACQQAMDTKVHLFDILAKLTSTSIDWQQEKSLDKHFGLSDIFIDHVLSAAQK